MIELDYDHFDFVAGFLHIPANVLWYRSARVECVELGEESIYVGPKYVTDADASQRVYCSYYNPRPLRVLDVRFVQQMIPYILTHRLNQTINATTMKWYKALCIAFGSCSLKRQIELIEELRDEFHQGGISTQVIEEGLESMRRFLKADPNLNPTLNPIEKCGIRISITEIDYFVIHILRQIFTQIDGIISPVLDSPFYGSTHPELVVFHPKRVLQETVLSKTKDIRLQDLVHQTFGENGFLMNVQIGYNIRIYPPEEPKVEGGKNRGVSLLEREIILSKLRRGVKTVLKKYRSAEAFSKTIEYRTLPRFLWKFMVPRQSGEMYGVMDWNLHLAAEIGRMVKPQV